MSSKRVEIVSKTGSEWDFFGGAAYADDDALLFYFKAKEANQPAFDLKLALFALGHGDVVDDGKAPTLEQIDALENDLFRHTGRRGRVGSGHYVGDGQWATD